MPPMPTLCALAYLVGGIPFSFLVVKAVFGEDIRRHGSGNVGATNASRIFPAPWRFPAFLGLFALDASKGLLSVLLLPRLFPAGESGPARAGLFAVLGHTFPVYLRFRGGKGVATTLGVLAGLEPVATAIAILAFALVYLPTRIVGAGSLALAIALPVAVYARGAAAPAVGALSLVLAALIIVRHRSNIVRMMRREQA